MDAYYVTRKDTKKDLPEETKYEEGRHKEDGNVLKEIFYYEMFSIDDEGYQVNICF